MFCRVRPLLQDNDSSGAEEALISYPTSVESAGRGIDLMNQGKIIFIVEAKQKLCFPH